MTEIRGTPPELHEASGWSQAKADRHIPVPSQNLKPDILMMEPAEDRYRCDAPDLLYPAKIRSIFVQREMRPDFVVIGCVSFQNTAQVSFAEHDEVVEGFATYRSDEPLDVAVLPRRAWRRRVISNPHSTNAAGISWTISSVAVANQVTRSFIPREGISHLTRDPLGCRIARHTDADQSAPGMAKNDQAVEQLE